MARITASSTINRDMKLMVDVNVVDKLSVEGCAEDGVVEVGM